MFRLDPVAAFQLPPERYRALIPLHLCVIGARASEGVVACAGRSSFRQEKIMAFVFTHRVSTVHGWAKLQTGRRVAARLCRRLNLTPQERANLYVSRMPIAVITASLGGHPIDSERNR
jgi:hypothetical protein